MSTVGKINFEILSSLERLERRGKKVADSALLNPNNALALYDGEWLTLDSSDRVLRATDVTTPGAEPGNNSFLLFPNIGERGRTDTQAINMLPVLMMGDYEADTRIYDGTAAYAGGAAITAIGQPLKLCTVTIGSRNFTGIVGSVYNETDCKWVGYVTRLPANNASKLRFMAGWRR